METQQCKSDPNNVELFVMVVVDSPPKPDTQPDVSKTKYNNVKTIVAPPSTDVKADVSTDVADAVISAAVADTDNEAVADTEDKNDSEISTPTQNGTHQEQPRNDMLNTKDKGTSRLGRKRFECPICHQTFVGTWNRRRHLLRKHPSEKELLLKLTAGVKQAKCLMCQQKFYYVKYLRNHLTTSHDVHFDDQEITFNNEQGDKSTCGNEQHCANHEMEGKENTVCYLNEFLAWKEEVEKRTESVYILTSGTKSIGKNGEQVKYFRCNRSLQGNYVAKPSLRKQRSKYSDTVKMNSHCTSVIKMVSKPQPSGSPVTVHFCATHYGHEGSKERRDAASEKKPHQEPKVKRKYKKRSKISGSFETNTGPPTTMVDRSNHVPLAPIDCDGSKNDESLLVANGMTGFTNNMDVCGNSVSKAIAENRTLAEGLAMDSERISRDIAVVSSSYCDQDKTTLTADLNNLQKTVSADGVAPLMDVRGVSGGRLNIVKNGVLSPKQRFISSLQTFINVIERCPTDEVLNLAASGINEMTRTFVPLLGMELSDTGT